MHDPLPTHCLDEGLEGQVAARRHAEEGLPCLWHRRLPVVPFLRIAARACHRLAKKRVHPHPARGRRHAASCRELLRCELHPRLRPLENELGNRLAEAGLGDFGFSPDRIHAAVQSVRRGDARSERPVHRDVVRVQDVVDRGQRRHVGARFVVGVGRDMGVAVDEAGRYPRPCHIQDLGLRGCGQCRADRRDLPVTDQDRRALKRPVGHRHYIRVPDQQFASCLVEIEGRRWRWRKWSGTGLARNGRRGVRPRGAGGKRHAQAVHEDIAQLRTIIEEIAVRDDQARVLARLNTAKLLFDAEDLGRAERRGAECGVA